MATETSIPESVFLKKGETEENALKSESFEEKVTELLGSKATQLETVNTPLETSKPTDESGIFFQALSVPTVIANEHSNAPESCKAAKQTEPEEAIKVEEKAIENEVCEKDAPETVESFDSVAPIKKDQGDSDGVTSSQDAACEDVKETTEHVTALADFKDQDLNEAPKEFDKEEPEDKSVDAQEASEEGEIGSKDIEEQKSEASVKKTDQDEEIKEIRPSVEMEEKKEQNGLLHAITPDAYISTQTESQVETTEHEEKEQDVNLLEKDQDKDDITSAQEVTFEGVSQEKNDHNEDNEHEVVKAKESIEDNSLVGVSTQTTLVKESIKYEEPDDVKAIEKEDQGDSDGGTSLQQAPCVDVAETTTVIDFKEQDVNEKPREFIEVETEDKSLDVQEASEECEKGAKEDIETKPEESVEKAEKEEKTEEIKPEQEEEGTQNDDGLKEKSDSPSIKDVSEETGTEKDENEKEVKHSEIATVNKDENGDEEKQDVSVLEKDEVTSAEDVAFEKDLQEKNYQNEDGEREVVTAEETREKNDDVAKTTTGQHDITVAYFETGQGLSATDREIVIEEARDESVVAQVKTEQYDDGANDEREQKLEESVDETAQSYSKNEQEEYTEEIKPSVETIEEKDVCISTQIESQEEATKNEENAIESDGDKVQTTEYKVKATESEENNDEETIAKDDGQIEKPESSLAEAASEPRSFEMAESKEKLEKEDEVKTSEVQSDVDNVASSQDVSSEEIKETTIGQHEDTVAYVEEGQGVSAPPKVILVKAEDKSIDAEELSLELGQPNEQNVEETHPIKAISENPEDEIKKEVKDLSHERVEPQDEPVENHSFQDEVSKEKVADSNETTEVEPREDIIPSTALETSTEDTLNSEKEKAESEILPIEDLETVSEVHVPELVPKTEESVLKEECFISEAEKHLDEEKEITTKEILNDEKTQVQGGKDDVTSSQNESNEDILETTISQHVTPVAYVEDSQDVSSTPKEILVEEVEDKSIDVGETHPDLSKTTSQNPEEEIKIQEKDLSHESVEDTVDDTTKEEKCTLEQETVKEHSGGDEVSKEDVTRLNETIDVQPQEDITPSTLLETSTEDTSNSEKEKAETENLPIEDLETVSEVQIPELVPKSEDLELKEEFFITETETHLDEEKEIISKEISSDEKTKVQGSGDDVISSQNASNEDIQDTTIGQHVTPVAYVEDGQDVSSTPKEILIEEAEDKSIDVEEKLLELGQPNEPSVEETPACPSIIIDENPQNETKKEDKDLSYESVEDTKDDTTKEEKYTLHQEPVEEYGGQDEVSKEKVTGLTETIDAEPQEDITPSTLLETSTEDASNSEKEKEESEILPIEEHETVSEVQIPELVPKSEEPVLKEEGFISETETHLDDEKDTIAKEISSDEKPEQTTEIKNETVKEVCEETSSEKTELEEGLKLSDNSKDDDQEKDHEVSISSESKGEDNITSSLNEVSEEKEYLQETNYHNEGNEGDVLKTGEGVDEETKENTEHVIATNVSSSTQTETDAETIEKEEKSGEKATEYDEKEIVSREVNLENKQEDVEETKIGEHAITETYSEEGQSLDTVTKEVLVKEEGDKFVIAQEVIHVTEQYDDGENDEREQKPEEHTDGIKPHEQNVEETPACPSKIISENPEDEIRKEDKDLSQESVEEANDNTTKEEKYVSEKEPVQEYSGQDEKEKVNDLNETIEVEPREKVIDFSTTLNENETLSKEEKVETEYDIKTSEVQGGEDDVTSSHDASNEDIKETAIGQHYTNVANVEEGPGVSVLPKEIVIEEAEDKSIDVEEISLELGQPNEQNVEETPACPSKITSENPEDDIKNEDKDLSHESVEDTNDITTKEEKYTSEQEPVEECSSQDEKEKITDLNETIKVEPQEDITPSASLETSTEDTLNSETVKAEENLPIEDLETVPEPKSEESVLKEECFVSETETHLNEEKGTITKEITSDETTLQTTEIKQETVKEEREEGLKLSDSSNIEISEKGITSFEDDVQEKDQEVYISAESQGEDNITSSRNEVSEEKEDLQEKNYLNEGNEDGHIKSGEGEEVKSSVETKEYTEHVTHIEPEEETTDNKEKDGEKAIENDENEIVSTEKEQELEKSELQGGGDDVISSETTSIEDLKETVIDQHATTTAHFEEGLGVNAVTREIVKEEVEDKSFQAQEASEQNENGAKDKIEQPEESVNEPLNSYSETIEESIKEEANTGNRDLESELDTETQADRTEDRSEMKDEAALTEKVTKELEQPKEQNVEEIQACLTETVSEQTEDKIAKNDEDSIELINENITKEERSFPDEITKEIETSTLEHEPVESQNESQDEVSKESFTDLKETTAVVSQEDATPSSSLETSTEDTSKAKDLESVSEVHIREVIPRSEECFTSATATHVDEKNESLTKAISSDENLETLGSTQQPENSYTTTEEKVEQVDVKEDVTQETQLNSIEDCGETVKDVILTEEIEQVPSEIEKEKEIDDFKEQTVDTTVGSQVNLPNIESTRALESDNDVQISEVVADSEDSKEKEECTVLETTEFTDEKIVEEQVTKTDLISSAPDKEQENVTETSTKSDEAKSSDFTVEQKALTKENLEDDQVTIETKPQPEQSDITCENITTDHTSESKLERDLEDYGALEPENEIKTGESQIEITKNIILTDEGLDNTSTPNQKELENEVEQSKPIPVGDAEVTEVKAESQIEENIQAAEDAEASKVTHEDAEQTLTNIEDDSIEEVSKDKIIPVLEDSKVSEPQVNLPEIESIETPLNGQESNERCIEKEAQGNVGVEIKDGKSENEAVEDAIINEVLQEDGKNKESISTKDIINEEAKLSDELLETKASVEDTEDAKFLADNLNVKDETFTVVERPNEDSEIVESEFKRLEDTVTNKEKETLDEPQADDSTKSTYDAILSSTERDIEVAEIVPESKEASGILTDNLPESSPETLLPQEPSEDNTFLSQNDRSTEGSEVLPSVEKDAIDIQRNEKDFEQETKVGIVDVVSNVERSAIEPPHLDTKESTEAVIPVEDVKATTREIEVGSVDIEVPSVLDATVDKANSKTVEANEAGKGLLIDDKHLDSTCDQNKPIEEGSEVKKEPLEGALGTAATEELKISQKYVTDDFIEVSQTHPETQKYEVPVYNDNKQSSNEPHQKEITESKIVTEKTDSTHEQEEPNQPIAKSLIPEAAGTEPQCSNTVVIDQNEQSVSVEPKTDEEGEEEEEEEHHEDDDKIGSGSDAPVIVEASKDMEVKAPKKSHNILSGVGSKVKHSIAKVKKAITGKSSPSKA